MALFTSENRSAWQAIADTQVHYDACKYLTPSDLWEGALVEMSAEETKDGYTVKQIERLTAIIQERKNYTAETKNRILKFIQDGRIHDAIFEATKGSFAQSIASEILYREMHEAK